MYIDKAPVGGCFKSAVKLLQLPCTTVIAFFSGELWRCDRWCTRNQGPWIVPGTISSRELLPLGGSESWMHCSHIVHASPLQCGVAEQVQLCRQRLSWSLGVCGESWAVLTTCWSWWLKLNQHRRARHPLIPVRYLGNVDVIPPWYSAVIFVQGDKLWWCK